MNIFQSIEQAAREENLDFVVIGGIAVIEYGYSRLTADLDLLVRSDARTAWHALLSKLDYKLGSDTDVFQQYEAVAGAGWPVDLMFANNATHREISAKAKSVVIQGASMRLASLEDVLALKLHALKHDRMSRFLKDFDDVVNLVRINKIDLSAPKMRDLLTKYGNAELYEKIRRACAR